MDFHSFLQQGAAHAWLYFPVAMVLGALHGLEPGHSKTMMAAFIIAVRGTVVQAALLGLSAAISHSLVIWILAALALRFGSQWNVESTEPYFMIGTGVLVSAMAAWTIWRLRRDSGHHDHHHDHHHDEAKELAGPDGTLSLTVFEEEVPPRFRLARVIGEVEPVSLRTIRPNGSVQAFSLTRRSDYWESNETIPEPHAFQVESVLKGPAGESVVTVDFTEELELEDEGDDEHARMHAADIKRRFTGREVTTPQIVMFGLTGGLMPCPAALSILLICLQVKRFTLGFALVAGFSIGLALTLVGVGVIAAWGIGKIAQQSGMLSRISARAPYLSSGLLLVLGAVFVLRGVWLLH